MNRLSLLLLAAVACAPAFAPARPLAVDTGRELLVTGTLTYFTLDDVPRPLADLVAGALPGPTYFAVSNRFVCPIPVAIYTATVRVGQPLRCEWKVPRGV